jgi:hypothetical protein
MHIDGQWLMEFDPGRPCAIYQHGNVLIIVNEGGSLAVGRVISAAEFVILTSPGGGWQIGLRAVLQDNNTLDWRNGTIWRR